MARGGIDDVSTWKLWSITIFQSPSRPRWRIALRPASSRVPRAGRVVGSNIAHWVPLTLLAGASSPTSRLIGSAAHPSRVRKT